MSASSSRLRSSSPYTSLPRWRRWGRCLPVVPPAVGLALRTAWVLWRSSGGSLPRFLRTLARRAPRRRLDPGACLAVTDRLVRPAREHRCLPRALVLFGLLHRSPATDVRFYVGVRPNRASLDAPFAHAWVEVGGQPFGEPADPRAAHRVLYCFPAECD